MIEPAKFTYSLLGKTLEKQTKKNESQGGKNLKNNREKLVASKELAKYSLPLDTQKEIFQNLVDETMKEMEELHKSNLMKI